MIDRGIIYFDAGCGLCSASVRKWQAFLKVRGFELVPLQDPQAADLLEPTGELPKEIKLRLTDGTIIGGAHSLEYVARYVWWAFPFAIWMRIPGLRAIAVFVYRIIARNRRRISTACGLKPLMQVS